MRPGGRQRERVRETEPALVWFRCRWWCALITTMQPTRLDRLIMALCAGMAPISRQTNCSQFSSCTAPFPAPLGSRSFKFLQPLPIWPNQFREFSCSFWLLLVPLCFGYNSIRSLAIVVVSSHVRRIDILQRSSVMIILFSRLRFDRHQL